MKFPTAVIRKESPPGLVLGIPLLLYHRFVGSISPTARRVARFVSAPRNAPSPRPTGPSRSPERGYMMVEPVVRNITPLRQPATLLPPWQWQQERTSVRSRRHKPRSLRSRRLVSFSGRDKQDRGFDVCSVCFSFVKRGCSRIHVVRVALGCSSQSCSCPPCPPV